jgi:hypothetical protein
MRNWSNKGIAHCRSSGCFLVESVDPAKEDFFICEPIVHRAKAAAGPEIQRLFRPRPARPRRRGQTRQAAAARMVILSKNSNILGCSQLPGLSINYRRKHCETNIMVQNMRSVAEVVP